MYKRLALALGILAMVALALTLAPNALSTAVSAPLADMARIRVVHASPDAPNVDVWLDGSVVPALTDVPFKAVSDYLEVPTGEHLVQVVPTGQTVGMAVISATVDLTTTDYTIAAVDEVAEIAPLVLEDDNTPPMAGKAHVRFVHLSPDAPAVDIALADGGPVLFGNVAFTEVGTYLPVDAGFYDLEVRPAGVTNVVVLSLPRLTFNEGTVYTVFAMNFASALEPVLVADSGNARIRVVHASPDAPNVDVWLDGAVVPALVDVPFKAVSGYLPVSPGEHLVQVVPTGQTAGLAVISATLTFELDKDYTIAATDVVANITPVVYMDDNSAPADGMAHVRFIHLSPNAPAVNVYANDVVELFTDIEFQEASGYQPVAADVLYELYVRATADTSILALTPPPEVSFRKTSVYTVFAMGLLGDTPPLEAVVSLDKQYGSYDLLMPLVMRAFTAP